jgi:hypothetical protein
MEEEQETISQKLDRIAKQNEDMLATRKEKGWKLPWGKKTSKSQVNKGWTTVQIIRNNGNIDFIKAPIEDGTVTVDGIPRISTIDYKLSHKGKPFVIIPEWSLKPFSPVENYEQTEKDRLTTTGTRLILAKMEKEAIKPASKGFGSMGWIILVIVGLAVGYYFLKGGKLF